MSSCLWFSHRVWPSQLHSHPAYPPVLYFLHSRTHWAQHLDCTKCPHCVHSARVCACTSLFCSFIPVNCVTSSLLAFWCAQLTCEVSVRQSSACNLQGGWGGVGGSCDRQLKWAISSVDVTAQRQQLGQWCEVHRNGHFRRCREGWRWIKVDVGWNRKC